MIEHQHEDLAVRIAGAEHGKVRRACFPLRNSRIADYIGNWLPYRAPDFVDSMSDPEEIVLYSRSGKALDKVTLHKFSMQVEILIRGHEHFVWDEGRQHYREATVLSAAPKPSGSQSGSSRNLPIYNRAGEMVGSISLARDLDPPDILHCGLWQFVWKSEPGQYQEALVIRVAPEKYPKGKVGL